MYWLVRTVRSAYPCVSFGFGRSRGGVSVQGERLEVRRRRGVAGGQRERKHDKHQIVIFGLQAPLFSSSHLLWTTAEVELVVPRVMEVPRVMDSSRQALCRNTVGRLQVTVQTIPCVVAKLPSIIFCTI